MLIRLVDGNLPVPTLEVQGGELAGAMKGVEQVINVRQRMRIFDSDRIQLPEVDTEAQLTTFLLHHNHRRSIGTAGGTNNTAVHHLLTIGFCQWQGNRTGGPCVSNVCSSMGFALRHHHFY